MSKRITVFLSDRAEKYFAEVQYSLDIPQADGSIKTANQSQVITHCLEELALFEKITQDQVTNYLLTNYPEAYKEYIEELKKEGIFIVDAKSMEV
jgi:hypothetical protein